MRKTFTGRDLLHDEHAQGLTEFVILIPVILLFFFAFIQYFQVFRASQLGNYAAYMAARVYAVHLYPYGKTFAEEKAREAAALALAPVAHIVPGEIAGWGSPTPARTGLLGLAEGYLAARYFRLVPETGGGSVKFPASPESSQVNVEINYPQPIFIPGVSEMWKFVGGNDIKRDLQPLSEGLEGVASLPSRTEKSLPAIFTHLGISSVISSWLENWTGRLLPFPYINVQSKCSMGLEDWGSKNPEYRPRLHNTVDGPQQSDEEQQKAQQIDKTLRASQAFKTALDYEKQQCQEWQTAQQQREHAQRYYDEATNEPSGRKREALRQLERAMQSEAQSRAAYELARRNRQSTQTRLEKLTREHYGIPKTDCR